MAGNTPQQPDPQEVHDDLMATLAASRELGPEMDKSLAESYIQRHPELAGQKQAATQEQPRTPLDLNRTVAGLLPLLGIVYDPKNDIIEIALENLDHMIRKPREVFVEQSELGLTSLKATDGDGRQHIVQLREPLLLPQPA